MRILWLSDFYPPYIGGLERHVRMVAGELASRGHRVSVATAWHEATPAFEVDNSVTVYRLRGLTQRVPYFSSDPHRGFHPTAPDPFIVKELLKIIDKERPQIVIASGWILYSFLPIKARSGAKLFLRHHDYAFICPKRTLFINNGACSGPGIVKCYLCTAEHYGWLKGPAINSSFLFFSQFHRLIDCHLPISHSVAEANRLTDHFPPNVIHIVPAPVPDEIFECGLGDKPPSGIPEDEDYILFVGALTRGKGLEILLDAYQGLENKAKLVLIGTDWPDTPAHYPEGIIVIKNAPHDEVMRAFNRCLFSVVPSLWAEGFGQVAVEAMAAGKPVIASAHGGLTDIVTDQETGILVKPGDAPMLHEAMTRLLDNAGLRAQLGSQGYLKAKQRFTCTQVTNQIEQICMDVLAVDSN